ncbi:hypothetical protein NKR19_g809 [Coniochaeta hoffmannii]|uniref:Uncharacterized protein n=1 Tax=Coniochaeta hoffmannii TaxID=91930 RepID=A0AA38RZP5_9PEZI|nr:hypothetical protein NKR19_g809 [Coniochaeta hoffmannii]
MDTPKAADQRMTWDHVADKDLLGAICDELAPTQEQVRSVTARMHALGYTCTVKAISQHLQKLRKKEGTQAGDGASAGGTTPKAAATPKTPRKRAPAKPKNGVKTPTSKGKRKATESVAEDDDASDGSQPAPIKKAKAEPGVDDAMDQFVKFEGDDYEDGAV